jgi:hypothetical protein
METIDRIKYMISLRLTADNFLFLGTCSAIAAALPYAVHLLG